MYPTTAQSHLQLQHPHQGAASLGVQQPSYQYHHPTPPYYSQTEIFQGYSNGPSPPAQQPQQQVLQSQQKYLATPSNSFPQPSLPSTSCPPLATQQQLQQQQLQYQFPEQKQQAAVPLAINTKMVTQSNNGPNSAPMSSPSSRKQQQQSISQLAEFAAHMVCYLLYGHQSPRRQSQSRCAGTPPSSIPSSPLPGHNSSTCHCEVCNRAPYSPARSTTVPTPVYPQGRPTHRRMISESDIVQPKPMFRKFCLDVLSATLLSPSVILLSLKYIQQLMINLKESNKIVNTGDGAEYRFFTGALILANKFLDDNTFTNKTWADITGMKIKDVNHLEMQFLNGIDFRLFTSSHHYSEWLASLTQFTSVHMPSQHQVAYQQQAAAAQSPVSPMEHTNSFTESVSVRQHGSGSESRHSTQSLSMASISHYIDSVKHLQQKSTSSSRYQRVPSTAYNQTPSSSSQQQFMSLPPPSQGPHSIQQVQSNLSPPTHPHAYQQETQETARRKRSAVNAFDDSMERSPCYDLGSLPYSNHVPIRRQSHKRFSSSSSLATLMGISTGQDVFQSNGPSPSVQQQRHYQRSHRASSGSLSTPFRGQHQRSVSGSYYIDMTGYASNYGQESSQINLPMPNTFSRSGGIHPLERDQELGHRPPSRTDAYHAPLSMHHGSIATGGRSQAYRPSTPPQYSPNKCETTCHSSGCGSNVSTGPAASYDVDPRLWGPLDSLSLYAITTQAAKRVVAQSKALSSSANGLHMYYPTTLA